MTSIKSIPEASYAPSKPKKLGKRIRRWVNDNLLPPYTYSVPDKVLGITYGDSPHYDKPWFKNTLGRVHRAIEGVDDAYFWVHHRVSRYGRRHVVRTGLKPGWHDFDEVMFRACFAIMGRYVEEELGKIDEPDDHHYGHCGYRVHCGGGTDEAAIDLWIWYTQILPVIEDEEREDFESFTRLNGYDYIDKEKNFRLRQLIDLRQTLWT